MDVLKAKWAFLLISFGLVGLLSCATGIRKLGNQNLAFLYRYGEGQDQPNIKVFHHHEDSTTLFVSLPANALLLPEQEFNLPIELSAKVYLFADFFSKTISDSAQTKVIFQKIADDGELKFQIGIPTKAGSNVVATLDIGSNQNPKVIRSLKPIERRTTQSEDYHLIKKSAQEMLYGPYLQLNKPYSIDVLYANLVDTFFLNKVINAPKLPLPPHLPDNNEDLFLKTDTTIVFSTKQGVSLAETGVYLLRNNLDTLNGFFLFAFGRAYPNFEDEADLLPPIRYITTEREYADLLNKPNVRNAILDFWTAKGGDITRAKDLMNEYYSRVQYANRFFTSIRQGWQTDRGLIYSVLGRPSTIFKDYDKELWIYKTPQGERDFLFTKVPLPWCNNHYELNRNPAYEELWYTAVDAWRKGVILNNIR